MKTVVMTLVVLITLATLAGLTVVYAGLFNVSASWEDPAPLRWVMETTRENAVKSRATAINAPSLEGAQQIQEGFRSFRDMCAICHTPPGASPSPTALGLNPEPPDLALRAEETSAEELFWVIKNGIRMTGMPAWGWTHEDEELWSIVAFLKTLPDMSIDDYQVLDQKTPKGHGHGGAEHGDEGDDHDEGHTH